MYWPVCAASMLQQRCLRALHPLDDVGSLKKNTNVTSTIDKKYDHHSSSNNDDDDDNNNSNNDDDDDDDANNHNTTKISPERKRNLEKYLLFEFSS